MYGTLEQSLGPEMHQIPNINKNRWEWVVLCARWIYVYGRPGRFRGKDLKARLGGALEQKGKRTWVFGQGNLLCRTLAHTIVAVSSSSNVDGSVELVSFDGRILV